METLKRNKTTGIQDDVDDDDDNGNANDEDDNNDDDDEPEDIIQQSMLTATYRLALDQLQICQRSQRMNMKLPQQGQRRRVSILPPGKAPPPLDERVLNALKFERDLEALQGIFAVAASQDNPGEQSEAVKKALGKLSADNSEEAMAATELQESRKQLQELQSEMEHLKTSSTERMQALDERIADARYNLRCVSRVNDLEFNLVERWEAARIVQAEIWGENAERAYLRDILDYRQRLSREGTVSKQLHRFRSMEADELRQQIQEWQQKLATEMRRVDREAESWEMRIIEVRKSLQRHREVYEERVEFVREYRAKQDEEKRQHDLQVHRMQCAIRLQAWWRGTMVRRGLGPFKKKPKKGRRGKSKK